MSRPPLPSSVGSTPSAGRYRIFDAIASGGMARVHLGRQIGAAGFSRLVAIKRLHPHLAAERKFVSMFMDEARLAARVRHPNVVGIIDVVEEAGDLFLVMEYVPGETLSVLARLTAEAGERVPVPVAIGVLVGALTGLHAAHDAVNENGEPLGIVHRDVSPQNVIVGNDGLARVLDFGIAYAAERLHLTRGGELKGKLSYMAPEQLSARESDRRTDVYAAAIVLWELLTGRSLFRAETDTGTLENARRGTSTPPSAFAAHLPGSLDAAVMRALARDPRDRFPTARDFALALEAAVTPAPHRHLADWVERVAADSLAERAQLVRRIEASGGSTSEPTATEIAVPRQVAAAEGVTARATVASTFATSAAASATLPAVESQSRTHGGLATKAGVSTTRAGPRKWLVPVASAAVGAAIAGSLALALSDASEPATMRAGGAQLRSLAARVAPEPPATAPAVPATADVALEGEPTTTEPAPAPPPAASPVLAPRPAAPPPRAPTATPAKANCTPPFTVDKDGVRIPKPECF